MRSGRNGTAVPEGFEPFEMSRRAIMPNYSAGNDWTIGIRVRRNPDYWRPFIEGRCWVWIQQSMWPCSRCPIFGILQKFVHDAWILHGFDLRHKIEIVLRKHAAD